jgi:hypothetical protein
LCLRLTAINNCNDTNKMTKIGRNELIEFLNIAKSTFAVFRVKIEDDRAITYSSSNIVVVFFLERHLLQHLNSRLVLQPAAYPH